MMTATAVKATTVKSAALETAAKAAAADTRNSSETTTVIERAEVTPTPIKVSSETIWTNRKIR